MGEAPAAPRHGVLRLRDRQEPQSSSEAYWAEGFRNARVEARIENDAVRPNAVNVTFVVDRGPRVRIGRINFTGNEQFTDKRLRRTFKKTHQKSLNFRATPNSRRATSRRTRIC